MVITACQNREPVIEKVDAIPEKPNSEPELVEQVKEEEVEEFIEFYLDDEQITINLQAVPILKEYLHTTKDRRKATEQMRFERIYNKEQSVYLLEFSCSNDKCSYLAFNQTKDNQAHLIADLAKSVDAVISPEATKILFIFERSNKSLPQPLTNIVVIDIDNWDIVPLVNETTNRDILNFNWPLATVEWKDDDSISVTKPALLEPDDEPHYEWQEDGELPMSTITLRAASN
ncbi:hypothetical protein QGM71_16740 [Virgibacillus sp. C22-A2]|uniref:Lipoprotein n=1 Tax=Virgibacillus tibetensis TaxID=3042313 RepID=A0ABU6KJ20_9BACI|nr:hypothetical protein [Virgibacillus sp. C22-A2]